MASGVQSQPVPAPRRQRTRGVLTALPAAFWLITFFILPLVIVLIVSFMSRGRGGVGELPLTLANYERVFEVFTGIIQNSVWTALLTTIICLLVGYPLAFFISTRQDPRMRTLALFMIILPFWTNFLVRTYALQTILGREGPANGLLLSLGLIREPIQMLNTPEAVMIGLVYGFLPFMVLPIYASVERFDFRFVEAAHDLGANDIAAFLRVVLPMTLPGVIAGCMLVFIPAIGAFVTPDLLGGTRGIMIGNLITQQFRGSGNQPLGSALSIVLMAMVMIALIIYVFYGDRSGDEA
jgi:spermidine/putrescine transport system permease protein